MQLKIGVDRQYKTIMCLTLMALKTLWINTMFRKMILKYGEHGIMTLVS